MYEQLLPTRVYYSMKTRTGKENDVMCRLCDKTQETVAHILAGCSALALRSICIVLTRPVLKILFFEILHQLDHIDSVPPWYSQEEPQPVYENEYAQACWDVQLFDEHVEVRNNRIDVRIVDRKKKVVSMLEIAVHGWILENQKCKRRHKSTHPELGIKNTIQGIQDTSA